MGSIRKLTENYIATDVDDEVLIVDLDGGELFSLAGTAKAVWKAIDGTRDEAALAEDMLREFVDPEDRVREDIAALIDDFEKAALVERLP